MSIVPCSSPVLDLRLVVREEWFQSYLQLFTIIQRELMASGTPHCCLVARCFFRRGVAHQAGGPKDTSVTAIAGGLWRAYHLGGQRPSSHVGVLAGAAGQAFKPAALLQYK